MKICLAGKILASSISALPWLSQLLCSTKKELGHVGQEESRRRRTKLLFSCDIWCSRKAISSPNSIHPHLPGSPCFWSVAVAIQGICKKEYLFGNVFYWAAVLIYIHMLIFGHMQKWLLHILCRNTENTFEIRSSHHCLKNDSLGLGN